MTAKEKPKKKADEKSKEKGPLRRFFAFGEDIHPNTADLIKEIALTSVVIRDIERSCRNLLKQRKKLSSDMKELNRLNAIISKSIDAETIQKSQIKFDILLKKL